MAWKFSCAAGAFLLPALAVAQPIQGLYIGGDVGANFAGPLSSSQDTTKIYTDTGPVGVIALGVHSPIPHALFIPPFLLRYLRNKRFALLAYVGAVYAFGLLYWLHWAANLGRDGHGRDPGQVRIRAAVLDQRRQGSSGRPRHVAH